MSDNNREFENMLHDELMKEAENLPESLSVENITGLVSGKPQSKKKSNVGKIVAIAASFVFVFVAAIIGIKNIKPTLKPTQDGDDTQGSLLTEYNSYADIQKFFIDLKNETVRMSGPRYEINKFFNMGAKTATEDYATAENAVGGADSDDGMGGGPASETELQVQGVDEADIIKNDGKYLYLVRQNDTSKVLIVDPTDPSQMRILSEIKLAGDADYDAYADEMYVKGNRLIVTADLYCNENNAVYNRFESICCLYGSAETRVGVQIYDITDKKNPALVSNYVTEGNYVSSRMIGDEFVLIANYVVPLYNDDETLKDACIPSYWLNSEEHKVAADKITVLAGNTEDSYTTVLKFNAMGDPVEPEAASVLGGSDQVYCNSTDLYVSRWNYVSTRDTYQENTEISRFDLTDGIKYQKTVSIEGSILNQFSMDEYNGCFRIATCHTNEESIITVLDKDLNEVGKLSGIAKGESIYAIRFMGDTAYVVTFYQTDPLFVIDLSDPTNPTVVGELKIPGFSNMLYPYGEHYLIGVGMDGDENGSNGNLKVSLFDVSDPKNPREVSKALINGYADSPAMYIHKAFMRFGDTGEFAIPVCSDKAYLCTFKVEGDRITAYKKYVCEDENYMNIDRGAYIGNTVFTLSASGLTAFDRDSCNRLSRIDMQETDDVYIDYEYVETYNDGLSVTTEPYTIIVD